MPAAISTSGYSGPVHCELVVDGDSSTLTAVTIYEAGTDTEVALDPASFLHITDINIMSETGGDFSLVAADTASAGFYLAFGSLAATGVLVRRYVTPYRCPAGVVPKFSGAVTGRNTCVLEGFVRSA